MDRALFFCKNSNQKKSLSQLVKNLYQGVQNDTAARAAIKNK